MTDASPDPQPRPPDLTIHAPPTSLGLGPVDVLVAPADPALAAFLADLAR